MKPYTATADEARAFLEGRKTQLRIPVEPQPPSQPFQVYGDRSRDWYVENHRERLVFELFGSWRQSSPYKPGDRLWVREDFTFWEREESIDPHEGESLAEFHERMVHNMEDYILYLSDGLKRSIGEWKYPHEVYDLCVGNFGKTLTADTMPQWASRITLEVENVRVQRLRDISEEDALEEGISFHYPTGDSNVIRCAEYPKKARLSDPSSPQAVFANKWNERNPTRPWDANPFVWVFDVKVV